MCYYYSQRILLYVNEKKAPKKIAGRRRGKSSPRHSHRLLTTIVNCEASHFFTEIQCCTFETIIFGFVFSFSYILIHIVLKLGRLKHTACTKKILKREQKPAKN